MAKNSKPETAVVDAELIEESKAIALADQPEGGELAQVVDQSMFLEDAKTGNNFSMDDVSLPFIKIIQDMSPYHKKRDEKYVEGAEIGMFINSASLRIFPAIHDKALNQFDPGILVVPIHYTPSYTEWRPNRKGFAKDHGANAEIMRQTKKGGKDNKEDVLENGNIIQRAGLYYTFLVDEATGDVENALISMASTSLTVSRKWNTAMQGITIPGTKQEAVSFYMCWRLTTWLDKRDSGDFFQYGFSKYKPTVELGTGGLGSQLYLAARAFKKKILEGAVKVKHEQETANDGDTPF